MRLAKYRKRVKIERVTETADGIGGATEVYSQTGTAWAAVDELSGARALEYNQIVEGKIYEIKTRYRTDIMIDGKCRFTYKNRSLYVHTTTTDDMNKEYLIIAHSHGEVPGNALLTQDGIPILTKDGQYILSK